jgi:ABC-type dipeptide/oligopeptide/nickel transport system permease subunit
LKQAFLMGATNMLLMSISDVFILMPILIILLLFGVLVKKMFDYRFYLQDLIRHVKILT